MTTDRVSGCNQVAVMACMHAQAYRMEFEYPMADGEEQVEQVVLEAGPPWWRA